MQWHKYNFQYLFQMNGYYLKGFHKLLNQTSTENTVGTKVKKSRGLFPFYLHKKNTNCLVPIRSTDFSSKYFKLHAGSCQTVVISGNLSDYERPWLFGFETYRLAAFPKIRTNIFKNFESIFISWARVRFGQIILTC